MAVSKVWVGLAMAACGIHPVVAAAFDVYGFIPYKTRLVDGAAVKAEPDQAWLAELGVRPIEVVYDNKILSFPRTKDRKNNATISQAKVRAVAADYQRKQSHMISLDLESWDRFDERTPSRILEAIGLYRRSHPEAIIGLYATVPQNTFGWSASKVKKYDEINARYNEVAASVDYFSPSLYNYSGSDFGVWLESARYNISAARKYSTSKKIIPYVTPEVGEGRATRWLSYDEMSQRLRALESLGADGCIVWGSSRSRDSSGAAPVLDPESGWLRAVSDFAQRRKES